MRFVLVFLVLFMAIGVNLPDNMLARVGLDPDYLKVALAAWTITALVFHERVALIVVVVALCVGANLPAEVAAGWGIDRDIALAGLVAVVLTPAFRRVLD